MRRRQLEKKTPRRRKGSGGLSSWAGIALLSCAAILLSGGYLAQISATASKGYAIRSLQNEIDDLKSEKERLEFEVAKDRSMAVVEDKVAAMGMVPVSEIEYLDVQEPVVAKR